MPRPNELTVATYQKLKKDLIGMINRRMFGSNTAAKFSHKKTVAHFISTNEGYFKKLADELTEQLLKQINKAVRAKLYSIVDDGKRNAFAKINSKISAKILTHMQTQHGDLIDRYMKEIERTMRGAALVLDPLYSEALQKAKEDLEREAERRAEEIEAIA